MIWVEHNKIIFKDEIGISFAVVKENYKSILEHIKTNKEDKYIQQLRVEGKYKTIFSEKKLLNAMKSSLLYVEGASPIPNVFNIELTSVCPLRCPQCYCSLEGGRNIALETVRKIIVEAGKLGVARVNLSGGETLAYPHLLDVLKCCEENGVVSAIAISGWNFSLEKLNSLINVGVGEIYVSLNGTTREINMLTRDGYEYAVKALEILRKSQFENYYINWVVHNNNIDDFINMIHFAEKYRVKGIEVLELKPSNYSDIVSFPKEDEIEKLAKIIKLYDNKVIQIHVEKCFKLLRKYLGSDDNMKCMAGYDIFSVSVDGKFTPCRHIEIEEEFENILRYWNESNILKEIRNDKRDKMYICGKNYFM